MTPSCWRAVSLVLVVLVTPALAAGAATSVGVKTSPSLSPVAAVGTQPVIPAWIIVHGVIMAIAWLAIAPLGVASAILKRTPFLSGVPWFKFHYRAQMTASVLTIVGGIIAIDSDGLPADNAHRVMGLFLFFAVAVQVLSGLVRPHVTPGHATPPPGNKNIVVVTPLGALDPAVLVEEAQAEAQAAAPATTNGALNPAVLVEDAQAAAPATTNGVTSTTSSEPLRRAAKPPRGGVTVREGLYEGPLFYDDQAAAKGNVAVLPKTRARLWWEIYHKNMGRVMMIVALINVATGIHIAWEFAQE